MTESISNKAITNLDIINAQLPGYQGLQQIRVDLEGKISQILPMSESGKVIPPPDLQILDVAGDWVSLGGVDLQINGALGKAFTDLQQHNVPSLQEICEFLWQQGIDAFLPTLVTTSVENIQRSLSVIADFVPCQKPTEKPAAQILGVHLEGPFLNPHKRGAHPSEYLQPLTVDKVKQILGDYTNIVKVITLAPELDTSGEVIPYLRSLGITVSLGHSQATAAQAQQAFALGASMVTHAFNTMPGLHHREPGLLGAAIIDPNVWCGLIADGQHVNPIMIQLLLRASYYEQGIFLVSDALAPIGLADGVYPWDKRQVEVKYGTARLADGTLAGTTLPLLAGAQNLVRWGICEAQRAIAMATTSPRQAISLSGMESGKPATQLLRWHLDKSTAELTWQRLVPSRQPAIALNSEE